MANRDAPQGAGADWGSFLNRLYADVNKRHYQEQEQKEESKGQKRIEEEDALKCIEDTVNIMTSKLPEEKKRPILETILAGPGRRRPKFGYLENFKNDMEEMLMQLSKKESAAQL